jgi:hypothetical protein
MMLAGEQGIVHADVGLIVTRTTGCTNDRSYDTPRGWHARCARAPGRLHLFRWRRLPDRRDFCQHGVDRRVPRLANRLQSNEASLDPFDGDRIEETSDADVTHERHQPRPIVTEPFEVCLGQAVLVEGPHQIAQSRVELEAAALGGLLRNDGLDVDAVAVDGDHHLCVVIDSHEPADRLVENDREAISNGDNFSTRSHVPSYATGMTISSRRKR